MTKFHITWKLNPLLIPEDPEKRTKLWLSMLEMVKTELSTGGLTDWAEFCDLSGGYSIAEANEADLFTSLLRWNPYIIFDIKPVLTSDQVIESIKKAEAKAKAK